MWEKSKKKWKLIIGTKSYHQKQIAFLQIAFCHKSGTVKFITSQYHILTASLVSKLGPKLILIEKNLFSVFVQKSKILVNFDDFMKSGLQTQPIIFNTPSKV